MDDYLKIEKNYRCSLEITRDDEVSFWINISGHWTGCSITSKGDFKAAKAKAKQKLIDYIDSSDFADIEAFKWLLKELEKTEQLKLF